MTARWGSRSQQEPCRSNANQSPEGYVRQQREVVNPGTDQHDLENHLIQAGADLCIRRLVAMQFVSGVEGLLRFLQLYFGSQLKIWTYED